MTDGTLPTVLVVDDERMNREILADLLKNDCYVILAKDGPSALERVAAETVSLILLDASMPGMDGYDVLRRLKANSVTADIGVIFITSQTNEEDEERGLLLGAADYVAKPIRPVIVRARVLNHLKLAAQREELQRLSLQDSLTGIANRRCFDEELARAWREPSRGASLGLAMIDVDHFKQYNDRYGHAAGDAALRRVARVLAEATGQSSGVVARYGGVEFALFLTDAAKLETTLESVRANVFALRIAHESSTADTCLTVSCGGATASPDRHGQPEELFSRADKALYIAKRSGRNRVVIL